MQEVGEAKRYDVLDLSGSAYERGYKYGSHYRTLYRELLESHYRYFAQHLKVTKSDALKEAARFEKFVQEYSEDIAQEIQGQAEGAGIRLEESYFMGAMGEIFYSRNPFSAPSKCTSFGVRGNAIQDHLTHIGQNNDDHNDLYLDGHCTTLTKYHQKDKPDVLIYTYPGVPAQMGINSSGLSICGLAMAYNEVKSGVPAMCITREILNQTTTAGAINAIERAKRAYSQSWMIGTNEAITNVEVTPYETRIMHSDDILYHTNHFMSPVSGLTGLTWEGFYDSSRHRCDRMKELLLSNTGKLNLGLLQSFLRDHANGVDSICSHPDPAQPRHIQHQTFDSMIYIPEKREAWIAKGNPCQSEYAKYVI